MERGAGFFISCPLWLTGTHTFGNIAFCFLSSLSALLLLLLLWEHDGQAQACRCALTPPAAMDCIYTQGEPLPHIGAYTRTRENKISTRESESVVAQAYHISHTHDSILPRIGRWVWCGGGWRWLKSRNPLPFSGGVGGFLLMAQPRSLAEMP